MGKVLPMKIDNTLKARILSEALPYIKQFAGCTVVIKFGGSAMNDDNIRAFAKDVVLLKHIGVNPIVVHGGGPQIGEMLDRLKIKSEFIDGLRVTDKETADIVEMVLCGSINKKIVTAIQMEGGKAIGLSGKDDRLMEVRKLRRSRKDPGSNIERVLDLGFVGEPTQVNPEVLFALMEADIIPVVAPIGIGRKGETYNVNADTAAGAIAAAVQATRFYLLTDVEGVLDKDKKLISELTTDKVKKLMRDGTISGGMIPKVETCVESVDAGVAGAIILDGRLENALVIEMFTDEGVGTLIRNADDSK